MTGPEALFSAIVGMSFFAALVDHYFIGIRESTGRTPDGFKINRTFLLGCFIVSETWVALDGKPVFFLYVSLNLWGLYFLHLHKYVPLGTVWLKRRKGTESGENEDSSRRE